MILDKRNLYREPWSMNDNPIAWLEITDICNLHCEGCYRQRLTGHKSLEQIKEEVLFFKRWRNPDNVSIAGGEPLIHPQILDIVAFIRQQGIKPVILTNGVNLSPDLLRELKQAGLSGFTIHVDSHQGRHGWEGKNEKDLNALRMEYADMIAATGGLYVIFNATVYPSTYHEIGDIVRWGQRHPDKVHGLVFITYRTGIAEEQVAYDSKKQEVDLTKLSYVRDRFDEHFVTAPEVYQAIKEALPEYEPSGYLGGTVKIDSYKWLHGACIASKHRVYGSLGKRGMEIGQVGHHLLMGTYLSYLNSPKVGPKVFLLGLVDKGTRAAAKAWLKDGLRRPWRFFAPIYTQSMAIIQAPDIVGDGRADMCDSCPDMTVWNGQLINSCRMDEYRLFGGFLDVVAQRKKQEEAVPTASE
jgi:MoaA/NifB/PqqE/SkfB family radical SAM enzyme